MDSNGLYDIYGMWHVPWWQRPLFLWVFAIIGGMVVILLFAFIIKMFFFKKKQKTPWEVATMMLVQAHDKAATQQSDTAQFYAQVTSILKVYLIARYQYDVIGRTDTELLAFVQEHVEFPAALVPVLSALLSRAEFTKFAKGEAILDQIHEDYALSLQIIRQTIPSEKEVKKS